MPTDPLSRVDAWGGAWEAVEDVTCRPCIWLKTGYPFRGFNTRRFNARATPDTAHTAHTHQVHLFQA